MDSRVKQLLQAALRDVRSGQNLVAARCLDEAARVARLLGDWTDAHDCERLARWAREEGDDPETPANSEPKPTLPTASAACKVKADPSS